MYVEKKLERDQVFLFAQELRRLGFPPSTIKYDYTFMWFYDSCVATHSLGSDTCTKKQCQINQFFSCKENMLLQSQRKLRGSLVTFPYLYPNIVSYYFQTHS